MQALCRRKKPRRSGVFLNETLKSGTRDIRCLLTLGSLCHIKGDFFALFEGLESAHGDRRKMREKVFTAVVRRDETKTLGVVEPLDCTSCHIADFLEKMRFGQSPLACLQFKNHPNRNIWPFYASYQGCVKHFSMQHQKISWQRPFCTAIIHDGKCVRVSASPAEKKDQEKPFAGLKEVLPPFAAFRLQGSCMKRLREGKRIFICFTLKCPHEQATTDRNRS